MLLVTIYHDGALLDLTEVPETEEEALAYSIQKWKLTLRYLKKRTFVYGTLSANTCGLCRFESAWAHSCSTCPVYWNTGLVNCKGTPYEDFSAGITEGADNGKLDWEYLIGIAEKEIKFLESLAEGPLPEVEVKVEKGIE